MLIRLLMFMMLLVSLSVASTTTTYAQSGTRTDALKLRSVTAISQIGFGTFGNGRTSQIWEFDFDSNNAIAGPNAFLESSITLDMFEMDDPDMDAVTTWNTLRITDAGTAGGTVKVGGASGTDMQFRSIIRVNSLTLPGVNGTLVPRFKAGAAVMTCDTGCTQLVTATSAALTPAVTPTGVLRNSGPVLTITRGQSTNNNNTQAAVGDDMAWTFHFSGTDLLPLQTRTQSNVVMPPVILHPTASPQFHIRAIAADGSIALDDDGNPIPAIDAFLRLETTPEAGRYTVTGTPVTPTSSAFSYVLFTQSNYSFHQIRNNEPSRPDVLYWTVGQSARSSLTNNSDLSAFTSNTPPNPPTADATPSAALRYAHIPTVIPTLNIARDSTTTEETEPAGSVLKWDFDFTNINPNSIIQTDPSTQFQVCYDDNDPDTTDDTLDLTLSGTGNIFTATSDPTPSSLNTFVYHICTLPAAVDVRSTSGGQLSITDLDPATTVTEITTTSNSVTHRAPPDILSITRFNDVSSATLGGEVKWTVTFNNIVTGVDGTDFTVTNAPNGTTLAVDPNTDANEYTVTATLPSTSVTTDTDLILSLSSTNNLGIALASDNSVTFSPTTTTIAGAEAAKYVLNTGNITASFGTPTNDNYSVSFPITFAANGIPAPITLDTNDHAGLFTITQVGTSTTLDNIIIEIHESQRTINPILEGISHYVIKGIIPDGISGSVSYMANFEVTNSDPVISATTDASNRVSLTDINSSPSTINVAGLPEAELVRITLNSSTLPAEGSSGPIEFIAEFDHPVSGVTASHFTVGTNNVSDPTIDSAVGNINANPPVFAAVRGIEGCYAFGGTTDPSTTPGNTAPSEAASTITEFCTHWRVPTTSISRAADSNITITANIDSSAASSINPLGPSTGIKVDNGNGATTTGLLTLANDIQAPFLEFVYLADREGNIALPPPPPSRPPPGTEPPPRPTFSGQPTSGGDVSWLVLFNEPVTGVTAADFSVNLGSNIRVAPGPVRAGSGPVRNTDGTFTPPVPRILAGQSYIITATLPIFGITTDTPIILSLSSVTGLDIVDTSSNPFAPTRVPQPGTTTLPISGPNIYLLNNDDDEVNMTVSTIGNTNKGRVLAGRDMFNLWQIDFDKPVRGITTSSTTPTKQFAIQIGEQIPGVTGQNGANTQDSNGNRASTVDGRFIHGPNESHDGELEIYVIERIPGRSYTIRARLPKAGYPAHSSFTNYTSANLRTANEFSNIVSRTAAQNGISSANAIVSNLNPFDASRTSGPTGFVSRVGDNTALTGDGYNNVEFNTGDLIVRRISSVANTSTQVDFLVTFGVRVSNYTASNFTINGATLGTVTPARPNHISDDAYDPATFHNSRTTGQSGQFAYTWRISTSSSTPPNTIAITLDNFDNITFEGPQISRAQTTLTTTTGTRVIPQELYAIDEHRSPRSYNHVLANGSAPTIESVILTDLERISPLTDRSSSGVATWAITFSEPVRNVAASHFATSSFNGTSYGNLASTSTLTKLSDSQYSLTTDITASATSDTNVVLRTTASSTAITDLSTHPASTGTPYVPTDNNIIPNSATFVYNTDASAPTVSSVSRVGSAALAIGEQAQWRVTFNSPVSNSVSIANFDINFIEQGGTESVALAGASISGLRRVSSTVYTVSAILPTSTGDDKTYRVQLVLSRVARSRITDPNGNALTHPTGTLTTAGSEFTFNTSTGTVPPINVTFGTPTTDGYGMSFPVTFDPPVFLNPDTDASLFTITSSAGNATNIRIVAGGNGNPAFTGEYIIRGTAPSTGSYTANLVLTAGDPDANPAVPATRLLTANDTSGRTVAIQTHSSRAVSASRTARTSVAISGPIALRTETLPEVGEIGAIEFLVTFNYPIRGLTGAHFALAGGDTFPARTSCYVQGSILQPAIPNVRPERRNPAKKVTCPPDSTTTITTTNNNMRMISNTPIIAGARGHGTPIISGDLVEYTDAERRAISRRGPLVAPTHRPGSNEYYTQWIISTTPETRGPGISIMVTADIDAGNFQHNFGEALDITPLPPLVNTVGGTESVAVNQGNNGLQVVLDNFVINKPPTIVDMIRFGTSRIVDTAGTETPVSTRFITALDGSRIACPSRLVTRRIPGNPNSIAPTFLICHERSNGDTLVTSAQERYTLGGPVAWHLQFSEPVTGVTPDDFVVSTGGQISVHTEDNMTYVISTTLPQTGYLADVPVELSLARTSGLGITDMATSPAAFAPPETTIAGDHQYILNTDDDEVVLTIDRANDDSVRKQIGDNSIDALWNIEFSKPVRGLHTSTTVPSTQFSVLLNGNAVHAALEADIGDIYVNPTVGGIPGRSFTISVNLPEAGYPSTTARASNSVDLFTTADFNSITHGIGSQNSVEFRDNILGDDDPLTPSGDEAAEFDTGTLTVTDITSVTSGTEAVTYRITFGTRVHINGNSFFTISVDDGTNTNNVSTTGGFGAVDGTDSLFRFNPNTGLTVQGSTFAYTWQVTTVPIPGFNDTLRPRFTINNLSGIRPASGVEGPQNNNFNSLFVVPTGEDAYHEHRFAASPPSVPVGGATRVGSATITRGGEIMWDVEFNQEVVGLTASHFSVSHGDITGVEPRNASTATDGLEETRTWRVTATLSRSGQADDDANVQLTLKASNDPTNPTSTIMGAIAPLSGGGTGRLAYATTSEIDFTNTFTYRTVNIATIQLFSYASSTVIDNQLLSDTDDISAQPDNTSTAPTQAPGLLRYEITYNVDAPAPTPTTTYDIICNPTSACDDTVSVIASAESTDARIHYVDITNIPTDATTTISLRNHAVAFPDATTIPADINLSTRSDTAFYIRPAVTYTISTVKTATDAIIVLTFSEPVDDFLEAELVVTATGASGAATFTFDGTNAPTYTYTTAIGNITASTDVTATLTDTTPFINATSDSARIFDPADSPPLPVARTVTRDIDDFTEEATVPFVELAQRFSSLSQVSGDITWEVRFDQEVQGVQGSHFNVIATTDRTNLVPTPTPLINNITPTFTTSDNRNFLVTATIPAEGIDKALEIFLSFDSSAADTTTGIMGAEGTTSNTDTTLIRKTLDPADSRHTLNGARYSVLNDARFFSLEGDGIDQANGTQDFVLTFSRAVMGLSDIDFAATDTKGSPTTSVMTVTPDSTTATTTYTITTLTTGTAAERIGVAVTLTLDNLSNASVASSSTGSVIALAAPETATQDFQDTQPPEIDGVMRLDTERVTDTTATPTIRWTVDFSEPVTGFDASDLSVSGGATIMSVTPDASTTASDTFTVTASVANATSPTSDTDIILSILSGDRDILDTSRTNPDHRDRGNAFVGLTGAAAMISAPNNNYILNTDTTDPKLSTVTRATRVGTTDISQYTRGGTADATAVSWNVTFNEPVMGVQASHFAITGTTGTPTIRPIAASTDNITYIIVADLPTTNNDGVDVHLSFHSSATAIQDMNSNGLELPTISLQITSTQRNSHFVLDNTPPELSGLTFVAPVGGSRNIAWTATFSEPVNGLTANSFTVSAGSNASGFTAMSPTAGVSNTWTFITTNTRRFGGTTTVTERRSGSGIVNASNFPVIANTQLMTDSYTFNSSTVISSIVPSFTPTPASRDGLSQAMRVGNLDSVTWVITYNEATPAPSRETYAVNCSCSDVITVDAPTVSSSGLVHTVVVSSIPSVENGSLTIGNGSDGFTDITSSISGNIEVFIDTVSPSSIGNIESTSPTTSRVTFTEPVIGLVDSNFTFRPALVGSATYAAENPDSDGASATWIITIPVQSSSVSITFEESMRDDVTGVVTGGTDIAGNAITGRNVNGIIIPPDIEVIEMAQELSVSYVERQAAQIITNTPSLSTRLVRTQTSSITNVLDNLEHNFSADVTNDHSSLEYTGDFIYLLPDLTDLSYFGGSGEFWTSLTYSSSDIETGAKSTSFYSTTGIDFVASEGLVWGMLVQVDMSDETGERQVTSTGSYTSDIESFGWLAGPYIVYDTDGFSLSGRAAIGGSSSEISPFGGAQSSDEYDSDRLLLSAGVTSHGWGGISGLSSWSYSPSLNYSYYSESVDSYNIVLGSLAPISVAAVDYELNRLEFGHTFSRTYRNPFDDTLTPTFGVSGVYDSSTTSSTDTSTTDLKARLDAGLVYGGASGINWNASVYHEGIGSDNNTTGLSIGLGIDY